jgi:hypothetical protein
MPGLEGEKSQKLSAPQVTPLVKQIWCLKVELFPSRNKYLKICIIFYFLNYNPVAAEKKRIFFFAPCGGLKGCYDLSYCPSANQTLSFRGGREYPRNQNLRDSSSLYSSA